MTWRGRKHDPDLTPTELRLVHPEVTPLPDDDEQVRPYSSGLRFGAAAAGGIAAGLGLFALVAAWWGAG